MDLQLKLVSSPGGQPALSRSDRLAARREGKLKIKRSCGLMVLHSLRSVGQNSRLRHYKTPQTARRRRGRCCVIGWEVVVKLNGAHIINSASQEVIPFMEAPSSHCRSADGSYLCNIIQRAVLIQTTLRFNAQPSCSSEKTS